MNLSIMIDFLRSDGSIITNKALARKIGRDEASIYAEILSKFSYFLNKNKLYQLSGLRGLWFYCTVDDLEYETCIKKKAQQKAISNLVTLGLIKHENRKPEGFSSQQRFFQIVDDTNILIDILKDENKPKTSINTGKGKSDFSKESKEHFEKLNPPTNNTNIYNTNNKKDIVEQKKPEENFDTEIQEVISYLNNKTNKNFKHTTKEYRKHITARFKEGRTLDDFKKVIDIKASQWLDTDMDKFLRPETLFGNKFEGYINEKSTTAKKKPDNIPTYKNFDQRQYDKDFFDGLYKNIRGTAT